MKTTEDFVISRTFDAPRELMFKMWTDPKHMHNWFSPKGFTVLKTDGDVRAGGFYHYGMRMENGTEVWGKWLVREVQPPARLVFINTFSDPEGGLSRHPFTPHWPQKLLTTVTFEEGLNENLGKTTVTIHWAPFEASDVEIDTFDAGRGSMTQGWTGTLDNLTNYVASLK
jgi:uncharacterized protein YndB with AHSA1/START domain